LELNRIYNKDCLDGLRSLPDNSIDLTVTSPPYDNLRSYNGYSFPFEEIAAELFRVTKEGGTVVWIVNDATVRGNETGTSFRQALYFKEIGFNLWDTMIWQKSNPAPQVQHPRYQPSFEYMFVLTKGFPKTFNPLTEPSKNAGVSTQTRGQRHSNNEFRHEIKKKQVVKKMKRRTNIWTSSLPVKDPYNHHPATFPEILARDHILSWSNEGDVVLDIFLGSGTTAKMAKANNRHFIGFEISKEYCEIADKRLEELENETKD
jgi:DNA modification methylase